MLTVNKNNVSVTRLPSCKLCIFFSVLGTAIMRVKHSFLLVFQAGKSLTKHKRSDNHRACMEAHWAWANQKPIDCQISKEVARNASVRQAEVLFIIIIYYLLIIYYSLLI